MRVKAYISYSQTNSSKHIYRHSSEGRNGIKALNCLKMTNKQCKWDTAFPKTHPKIWELVLNTFSQSSQIVPQTTKIRSRLLKIISPLVDRLKNIDCCYSCVLKSLLTPFHPLPQWPSKPCQVVFGPEPAGCHYTSPQQVHMTRHRGTKSNLVHPHMALPSSAPFDR